MFAKGVKEVERIIQEGMKEYEESKKSNHRQKVGCVIFDKKRIISKGHNYSQKSVKKFHPKFQKFQYSIHAEVDAIIKAKRDFQIIHRLFSTK